MLALLSGAIWAGMVIYLLARILLQFRAYQKAVLSRVDRSADLPAVSIIVPVRNEIENIGLCLAGLEAQTCLTGQSSITIVDDDSQDGTAAALEHQFVWCSRARPMAAGALPDGWVGKSHACWRGALLAEGDWLCFIDADVRAAPQLVATALTTANVQGIDMLSVQPLQELVSFWERLVIPAGLLMIACAKSFRTDSQDIANGQFLLIRRQVYFQVGGHAAVRAEVCEDKALAARVKDAGFTFRVLAAEELARTRMYRDFRSLWEGLGKNATDILGSIPVTLAVSAAAVALGWTTLLLPMAVGAAALSRPSPAALIGLSLTLFGSATVIGIQFGTARHFRVPAGLSLIFVLGYTVAACLACYSVVAHLKGRVTWKGRTYQLNKTTPGRM